MRKLYSIILVSITILVLQGCKKQDNEVIIQPDAANSSSDVATDWMQLYRHLVRSEGKNPPQASRIYAYGAIGLYQAVLPGMSGYQSLDGQISGLYNLPFSDALGRVDYTVTANEALYTIALNIFGTLKPESQQLIEDLHTAYYDSALLHANRDLIDYSVQFGNKVAAAVLNRSNNDNFANTRNLSYTVPSSLVNPAWWSPTGAITTPLEPYWGILKSFSMTDNSACTVKSAIPFSMDPASDFYKQAGEVLLINQNLTDSLKAIANWWADGTGTTPTPPGHWIGIAGQLIKEKKIGFG